jgi:hypothetical protein
MPAPPITPLKGPPEAPPNSLRGRAMAAYQEELKRLEGQQREYQRRRQQALKDRLLTGYSQLDPKYLNALVVRHVEDAHGFGSYAALEVEGLTFYQRPAEYDLKVGYACPECGALTHIGKVSTLEDLGEKLIVFGAPRYEVHNPECSRFKEEV